MKQQSLCNQDIASAINEPILIVGPDYTCRWVNAACCRALGKNDEEIIGHSLAELVDENTFSSQVKQELDRSLAGEVICADACFPVQDGSRTYRVSYAPITHNKEAGVSIVFTQDVTTLRATTALLLVREKQYHTLVDLIPLGINRCDLSGGITHCNPAFTQIFGYSQEELLKKNIWDMMATDRNKMELRKYFHTLVHRQPEPQPFVGRNRRKDGAIIDVEMHWAYERNHADVLTGFIAVANDITWRMEIETALRAAHDHLSKEVVGSAALRQDAVENLHREVGLHMETSIRLGGREQELSQKAKELAESDIALKVLLQKGHEQKHDLEAQLQRNIVRLVLPILESLKKGPLNNKQLRLLELIGLRLGELADPGDSGQSACLSRMTPTEITVANLIKQGRTTKEIAEVLGSSPWTVNTHRENIRKKIGIKNSKQSLRKTLLSIP